MENFIDEFDKLIDEKFKLNRKLRTIEINHNKKIENIHIEYLKIDLKMEQLKKRHKIKI